MMENLINELIIIFKIVDEQEFKIDSIKITLPNNEIIVIS